MPDPVNLDRIPVYGISNFSNLMTYIYTEYDYTNGLMVSSGDGTGYNDYFQVIYQVYSKGVQINYNAAGSFNSITPINGTAISQADADAVADALRGLAALAVNGKTLPVDATRPDTPYKKYFLTVDMARNLDALYRTFVAAGIDVNSVLAGGGITQIQLQNWKDLSILSSTTQTVMIDGANIPAGNRSLQALIELEYVKTANELINAKMTDLEKALSTTKNVLDTLTQLQQLHNQLTTVGKSSIEKFMFQLESGGQFVTFNYNKKVYTYVDNSGNLTEVSIDSGSEWVEKVWTKAASAYFGSPISPQIVSTYVTYNSIGQPVTLLTAGLDAIKDLLRLKSSIAIELSNLDGITSAADKSNPASLFGRLKAVLSDLNSRLVYSGSGGPITLNSTDLTGPTTRLLSAFSNWMLDSYDKRTESGANAANAGRIQDNLTQALTAGQSLNDSQKQDVRNFLFIFEEYYKSASSILQAISQIITKMAQGIYR